MKLNELIKYKEMCILMNDTPTQGGSTRKTQLNKWKENYDIEKVTGGYIIIKEYTDEEKELLDNNLKFTFYIENLLIWLLKQNKMGNNYEVRMSYKDLFKFLNAVNDSYYKVKYNDKGERINFTCELAENTQIDEELVNSNLENFFSETNSILRKMVKYALDSMQKRSMIIYSKAFRFHKIFHYNLNGEDKQYIKTHECSDFEISEVLEIHRTVMNEFNIKDENYINYAPDFVKERYYSRVNRLVKEKFGYDKCYGSFKIILASGAINQPVSVEFIRFNKNVQTKLMTAKKLENIEQKEYFIKELIALPDKV